MQLDPMAGLVEGRDALLAHMNTCSGSAEDAAADFGLQLVVADLGGAKMLRTGNTILVASGGTREEFTARAWLGITDWVAGRLRVTNPDTILAAAWGTYMARRRADRVSHLRAVA